MDRITIGQEDPGYLFAALGSAALERQLAVNNALATGDFVAFGFMHGQQLRWLMEDYRVRTGMDPRRIDPSMPPGGPSQPAAMKPNTPPPAPSPEANAVPVPPAEKPQTPEEALAKAYKAPAPIPIDPTPLPPAPPAEATEPKRGTRKEPTT